MLREVREALDYAAERLERDARAVLRFRGWSGGDADQRRTAELLRLAAARVRQCRPPVKRKS
jgi:hypothetical protein